MLNLFKKSLRMRVCRPNIKSGFIHKNKKKPLSYRVSSISSLLLKILKYFWEITVVIKPRFVFLFQLGNFQAYFLSGKKTTSVSIQFVELEKLSQLCSR